jgi:hypothetical protein
MPQPIYRSTKTEYGGLGQVLPVLPLADLALWVGHLAASGLAATALSLGKRNAAKAHASK